VAEGHGDPAPAATSAAAPAPEKVSALAKPLSWSRAAEAAAEGDKGFSLTFLAEPDKKLVQFAATGADDHVGSYPTHNQRLVSVAREVTNWLLYRKELADWAKNFREQQLKKHRSDGVTQYLYVRVWGVSRRGPVRGAFSLKPLPDVDHALWALAHGDHLRLSPQDAATGRKRIEEAKKGNLVLLMRVELGALRGGADATTVVEMAPDL
jgi:hypothetical protein